MQQAPPKLSFSEKVVLLHRFVFFQKVHCMALNQDQLFCTFRWQSMFSLMRVKFQFLLL